MGDTWSPLGCCLTEDALREHFKTVTKCAFLSSPAYGEHCTARDRVLSMKMASLRFVFVWDIPWGFLHPITRM